MKQSIIKLISISFALVMPAFAQEDTSDQHQHDHHTKNASAPMDEMDHSKHTTSKSSAHESMDQSQHPSHESAPRPAMDHSAHSTHTQPAMDHGNHNAQTVALSKSGKDLRDPHAYSDGYDFGPHGKMHMMDSMNFSAITVDHLEAIRGSEETAYGYGLRAWWGRDLNRVLVKSSGEGTADDFNDLAVDIGWGHAIAAYWNTVLGVRVDRDGNNQRQSLAIGIEGTAPYWFEVDATLYVDTNGRIAFRGGAEYEMLFTQRLILQPAIEATAFSRSDSERVSGGGLSDISTALRLRYEIRREFAPYVGMEWKTWLGSTAQMLRDIGSDTRELSAVAGLRLMY